MCLAHHRARDVAVACKTVILEMQDNEGDSPVATVHQQVDKFTEFVKRTVPSQEASPSLEECLQKWRDEQELADTIESINRGVADIEAGRVMTIEEAGRQIRASLGLPAIER